MPSFRIRKANISPDDLGESGEKSKLAHRAQMTEEEQLVGKQEQIQSRSWD